MFGSGTEDDPYSFRENLQYYECFYQFLLERSMIPPEWTRQLWKHGDRKGDCVSGPTTMSRRAKSLIKRGRTSGRSKNGTTLPQGTSG